MELTEEQKQAIINGAIQSYQRQRRFYLLLRRLFLAGVKWIEEEFGVENTKPAK